MDTEPLGEFKNGGNFNYLLHGLLVTLIVILLYFFGGIYFARAVRNIFPGISTGIANSILQIFLMLIPALFAMQYTPAGIRGLLAIGQKKELKACIAAISGFIPLMVLYTCITYLQDTYLAPLLEPQYSELKRLIEHGYRNLFMFEGSFSILQAVLVAAIVPAVSEEMLFRGFLQGTLLQRLRPWTSIIITAGIFAIIHFNPIGLAALIMIGLYLGAAAYLTESIIVPIIIHFLNNLVSVITFYSPQLEQIDKNSNEAPLIYILVPMVISAVLVYWVVKYLISQKAKKMRGLAMVNLRDDPLF